MRRNAAPGVDAIVAAAIDLADERGLDAVTMRALAAALGTGTTSLYRVIDGRDTLVAAMIDGAMASFVVPAPTGDGRADLTAYATASRAVLLDHPWLGAAIAARPALGPHALRRVESGLAAATAAVGGAGTGEQTSVTAAARTVLDAVNAYVLGAVTRDIAERAPAGDGIEVDEAGWQRASGPRIRELLAASDLPHVARMVFGDAAEQVSAETRFARGLHLILDGVQTAGESR